MGSRVMHYCITSLLSQSLNQTDDSFLLGGLAPDVHRYMGQSQYYLTHFAMKDELGNTITDRNTYLTKYLSDELSPFHLGYYFHLISDEIWKEDIYYKKIKCLHQKDRKAALEKNYRDFWRLNGKIIDHHSLQLRELEPASVNMHEIDSKYFPELIKALHRDFELKDEASSEGLEFLDFGDVLRVIDKSARVCLDAYAMLKKSALQRKNPDPVEEVHGTH